MEQRVAYPSQSSITAHLHLQPMKPTLRLMLKPFKPSFLMVYLKRFGWTVGCGCTEKAMTKKEIDLCVYRREVETIHERHNMRV